MAWITAASVPGEIAIAIVGGLVVAAILWALGRAFAWPRIKAWRLQRQLRKSGEPLWEQLKLQVAYKSHLRDVMHTFWRARNDPPERIRERIRRDILEPIRGFIPTEAGEEVKVVWFRPDDAGAHLVMYEQVGHSEEGQRNMRLPVGAGLAGRAFTEKRPVWTDELDSDPQFQRVEKSHASGSLACVPIVRGEQCTGVLSVLCTRPEAFWDPDIIYFECLAGAIAALETLEESSRPAEKSG